MILVHIGLEHTVHLAVGIEPLAAHGVTDDLHARENQADAVLGALEQEVRTLEVEVGRLQPAEEGGAAHGTLHDAVGDFYLSDFKRSKQSFVFRIHKEPPFSIIFPMVGTHGSSALTKSTGHISRSPTSRSLSCASR